MFDKDERLPRSGFSLRLVVIDREWVSVGPGRLMMVVRRPGNCRLVINLLRLQRYLRHRALQSRSSLH